MARPRGSGAGVGVRECVLGRACGCVPRAAGGRARGGGGVGADRACVRERGGREGGRDHRAPPLVRARCLAMSEPTLAPTSSVWVSGSCPEGLCRLREQPTYPPGPGAGPCSMSIKRNQSAVAGTSEGRPPRSSCQWMWKGRGPAFQVWLTARFAPPRPPFFFCSWNQASRRRREEKGGTRERERSKSEGSKGDYVRDASFWAAAIWVDCFGFFSLTSKLFFTLVSSCGTVKTNARLLPSHFPRVPRRELAV